MTQSECFRHSLRAATRFWHEEDMCTWDFPHSFPMSPPLLNHLFRTTPTLAQISNRAIVSIIGSQCSQFLNGLLSTSVQDPPSNQYSTLLHAQARSLVSSWALYSWIGLSCRAKLCMMFSCIQQKQAISWNSTRDLLKHLHYYLTSNVMYCGPKSRFKTLQMNMTYGLPGALQKIIAGRPHGNGNGLQVGVGV